MKILVTTDTHYLPEFQDLYTPYLEEMKAQKPDLIIHPGDMANHDLTHLYGGLKMFRDFFKSTPLAFIVGNHDYWQHKNCRDTFLSWREIISLHEKWFEELNIHYLGKEPFIREGVTILGFDGWYKTPNPPTVDVKYLPVDIEGKSAHEFLMAKAHKDLDKMLRAETHGVVLGVTHFPMFSDPGYENLSANPSCLPFLVEKCDFLFLGHSHKRCDFMEGKCRIINPGNKHTKIPSLREIEPGVLPRFIAPKYTVVEV